MCGKFRSIYLATGLFVLIYSNTCYAANLNMKTYCSRTANISFPATGVGEDLNNKPGNPGYDETYQYLDQENFIAYQFFLKRIEPQFKSMRYLEDGANEKVKNINARLTSKKIYETNGKLIIDYSYEYFRNGIKKISYTRTAIEGNLYYSWAVQTYEGNGNYTSRYIFDNYAKYIGNSSQCK